jgi:PilZ domain
MLGKEETNARVFTRVRFSTRADVDVNGETLQGDLVDVSMNGIYMRSDATVNTGDSCEVRIILGDDAPMVIHALGHVARCDSKGFAVSFSVFYCDSDSCLKQVILHNADNPKAVEEEIKKGPKLAVIDEK